MDFLDAVVLNGLQQTSFTSLKGMWYQLSEAPLVVSFDSHVVVNQN